MKEPTMTNGVAGEPYKTVVESAYNYFAFGMLMPGQYYESQSYKHGFNGILRDDDIKDKINYFICHIC